MGSTAIHENATGISERIGNTPLLRLVGVTRGLSGVEVYAKAEWLNPGGSVKDRAALSITVEGERSGRLTPDRIILDATSGNTGIAYAMIAAGRGYRVKLCMPDNVSLERKRTVRAYGADLVLTDPLEGSDGAIREARRLHAQRPDLYFYADQYNNPANWRAHYRTTAVEIFQQTGGRITHLVAGLGTSGTFTGTGRRLKELESTIQLVSVQPDAPLHGLEGLKHMESAIVPGIYDPGLADLDLSVGTEASLDMVKRLAREDGLLVGISSGAAMTAALRVARGLTTGVVVVIFPDGGSRYLSERFWDE